MYHSSVVPIIDYGSGIWGYKQYGDGDKIGLDISKTCHHINMIRLWNTFINMGESRITKRVFNLDNQICKYRSLERNDMYSASLNQTYDNTNICNIDAAKCICANFRNVDWKNSILTKL